jgi:hypothetical protein
MNSQMSSFGGSRPSSEPRKEAAALIDRMFNARSRQLWPPFVLLRNRGLRLGICGDEGCR